MQQRGGIGMSRYQETDYVAWAKPASETEQTKIDNAINMVKLAIDGESRLSALDIEVFPQGSYANNTNVRLESDVDVCVMSKSVFFYGSSFGLDVSQCGYTNAALSYAEYRNLVKEAIVKKFGCDNVTVGNKSFKIKSNSYHVHADVVPSFEYRNHHSVWDYYEGIKFICNQGQSIVNYPKMHIKNGIEKNNKTNYSYKKLVRILKRVKNIMSSEKLIDPNKITSFLVESLIWHVPNYIITDSDTWGETIREALVYLYNRTKEQQMEGQQECSSWSEICGILNLFDNTRKWAITDANLFVLNAWQYLGFK